MNQIRISHPEQLTFTHWDAPGQTETDDGKIVSWIAPAKEPGLIACTGSFDSPRAFNAISVSVHNEHRNLFPNSFRFEISQDGKIWEPIIQEADFRAGLRDKGSWTFPLITARYIKFLFLADASPENEIYAAFGELSVSISGIVDVKVTSELDRLWVKENLIDQRPDYGWSSSLRSKRQEEEIMLDLGSINRVGELRLLSKNDAETFFPRNFRVTFSEDNISWHHLVEENGFFAEPATWYLWRFLPMNMRYIRITLLEGARTREGKYISQLIELELYASSDMVDRSEKSVSAPDPVQYASVLRSGLVRLAMDGEVREGVVVQGNDRRLRDATTETRGIVELASDGEERANVAVQGNDRRLKYATEDLPGIVRLARNGEARAGHLVQSHDHRLQPATEEAAGLVELASDGEERANVAVQGNDRRLKYATNKEPGIVRLAESGSTDPNVAVQGDDARLKEATTEAVGVLRFARNGETSSFAAVQGDDARLKDATTEGKGIVELARDGEERENVAVQGNDRRLKLATEQSAGIVEFCMAGSTMQGKAVQGNDPRLSDAREPLPHSHDYARREHSFDSHTGLIHLREETGKSFQGISPAPGSYAPITGENLGAGSGLAGKGRQGVIGYGEQEGLVGLSSRTGVLGASRSGNGGVFVSEKGFALSAGGERDGYADSGLAFHARGASCFEGSVYMADAMPSVIAKFFPVEHSELVIPGDALVASLNPGHLMKAQERCSVSVIGIVVENAACILSAPAEVYEPGGTGLLKAKGMILVAICGVVEARIIADEHPVLPGDPLITSLHSGRLEKSSGQVKEGSIVARALGSIKEGEGTIPVVLR